MPRVIVRESWQLKGLSFRKFNELAVDIGARFRVQKPLTLWPTAPQQAFSFQSISVDFRADVRRPYRRICRVYKRFLGILVHFYGRK
jgi:hypothetical protein